MFDLKVLSCGVLLFVFLTFATFSHSIPLDTAPSKPDKNETEAKLIDFQESSRTKIHGAAQNPPESRVHIVVGEDNGFHYTVDGHTYSRERIAISGEYFNDELNGYGYVRLFLVAEPSIVYYAVRPLRDRLDVYVQNYFYEEFYYVIYTPYPVTGYDLDHGQINSTAILVTGPSRSAVYDKKSQGNNDKPLDLQHL